MYAMQHRNGGCGTIRREPERMITTKHKVFLSPSDQTKNTYAVGNTSEDVQCGRIALAAKAALPSIQKAMAFPEL